MTEFRGNAGDGPFTRELTEDEEGELCGSLDAQRGLQAAITEHLHEAIAKGSEAAALYSQAAELQKKALRAVHLAWFSLSLSMLALGFAMGGIAYRLLGGSTP